jgi:hypothetical protein
VGCGDREETYYPVINCTKGCGEATASGEVLPRRRITVPPVQYTALVGRQDVIREVQGLGPESLTRLGWMCTVRSAHDWECDGASNHEQIAMVHGDPRDTTINVDESPSASTPERQLKPPPATVPCGTWQVTADGSPYRVLCPGDKGDVR